MTCHPNDRSINLPTARHLAIDDARGTLIRVIRGTVWITQERSYADIILHAGDAWAIENNGRTVIQAQDDACVCLPPPRSPWWHELRRQALHRRYVTPASIRRAARAWASLGPQRALPYY